MEEKSQKYNYIKFALLILVIIGHATRMYTNNSAFTFMKISKVLTYITNFIYGFHMPLFFMMSGAIFWLCFKDKNKYQKKLPFIIKKFKRLMVPYFFIGIICLPFVMIITKITSQNYFQYVFNGIILAKNSRHLWYLLYLFIFFIEFICLSKKKINKIITFCIYSFLCLIIYKFNIPYISDILYWSIYFYMGIIAHTYYDKLSKINFLILLILLAIYSTLVYFDFHPILLKLFGSILFFSLFQKINIIKFIPSKLYSIISENSMGIYLFHPLILYLIFYYFGIKISALILLPMSILTSLLLSIILTEIFKKLNLSFLLGN